MSFRILGLDPAPFRPLFGLSDAALESRGVRRHRVDARPGFPCRIALRDLDIGETALLMNHEHLSVDTPYRASHAIFVGETEVCAFDQVGVVPDVIRIRPISLRAFSAGGDMVDADLADAGDLVPLIERFLADPAVAFLHAHYARRGCYAARIIRT